MSAMGQKRTCHISRDVRYVPEADSSIEEHSPQNCLLLLGPQTMKIVVIGGTGLMGSKLVAEHPRACGPAWHYALMKANKSALT